MTEPKVVVNNGNSSGGGCLRVILLVLVLWALIFGVTWNGRHYEIGCSCDKGVHVQ